MHGGDMGVQERLKESGDRKGRIAKMPGKRGAEACRWTSVDPLEPPAVTPHRILRLMLLHIKYLYGIRVEVRGAHHFPPSQPYVVVSNHQSSLDLLGEALLEHTSQPCPPPSSWNSPRIFSRTRSPAPQLGRGCLPHKQGGRPSVTLPSTWAFPGPAPRPPLPLYPGFSSTVMTWVTGATSALMLTPPPLPQG